MVPGRHGGYQRVDVTTSFPRLTAFRAPHFCSLKVCQRAFRTGFKFEIGSGAGIRTLNLAVNRTLIPVQK